MSHCLGVVWSSALNEQLSLEHTPAKLVEITHLAALSRTPRLSTESVRKAVHNYLAKSANA
jgi:hypothetical protein